MEFCLFSASSIRSNAMLLCGELDPTDSAQPPDMVVTSEPCPFWVGMGVQPITDDHFGHGFGLPAVQAVPGSQLPSRSMASLPWGSHWALMVVAMFGFSSCSGLGASPWS